MVARFFEIGFDENSIDEKSVCIDARKIGSHDIVLLWFLKNAMSKQCNLGVFWGHYVPHTFQIIMNHPLINEKSSSYYRKSDCKDSSI